LPTGTLPSGQTFAYFPVSLGGRPTVNFGPNASVVSNVTSGYAIALSGAPTQINLLGSSATLQTSGGTIVLGPASGIGPPGPAVFPTTGQSLTFTTSAGASSLNLVGGQVVTLSPGVGTTISAGVTLTSDHGITFNVNSGTFTNN